MGNRNFDDVISASYSIYGMYATSKLAMMMFTTELAARYSTRGVKAVAVHPGRMLSYYLWTRLTRGPAIPKFIYTPVLGNEIVEFINL